MAAKDKGGRRKGEAVDGVRVALQERLRLVREGMQAGLRARGVEVAAAAGTGTQLRLVCAAAEPSVIVLDGDSPEAPELVRQLRRAHPDARILGLCSAVDARLDGQLLHAGAAGIVRRRAGLDGVAAAVRADDSLPAGVAAGASVRPLSRRQSEVLAFVARGCPTLEIAGSLAISPKTVEHHLQQAFAKLDVRNRAHAVAVASRHGLLERALGL